MLEWFNKDCPFIKKHYESGNMQTLQQEYKGKGVVWLTAVSSAPGLQGHQTPEKHKETLSAWKASPTAFLLDETGSTGRSCGAKTTPHMFIIDKGGNVVYQGAIDDHPSTEKSDIPSSKNYVKAALDEVLSGKSITTASSVPYGCSVKYSS